MGVVLVVLEGENLASVNLHVNSTISVYRIAVYIQLCCYALSLSYYISKFVQYTKYSAFVFKPGTRWPQAGACLVS